MSGLVLSCCGGILTGEWGKRRSFGIVGRLAFSVTFCFGVTLLKIEFWMAVSIRWLPCGVRATLASSQAVLQLLLSSWGILVAAGYVIISPAPGSVGWMKKCGLFGASLKVGYFFGIFVDLCDCRTNSPGWRSEPHKASFSCLASRPLKFHLLIWWLSYWREVPMVSLSQESEVNTLPALVGGPGIYQSFFWHLEFLSFPPLQRPIRTLW